MQQEGTTGARVPTTVVQLRYRFPNSTVAVGGENRAVSVSVVHSRTSHALRARWTWEYM